MRQQSICALMALAVFITPTAALAEQLFGRVTWLNSQPAKDVALIIGAFGTFTDGLGRYTINNIAPGNYAVTIIVPGKSPRVKEVKVNSGQATKWDFKVDW